jgi:hypothetical protein
MPTVNGFLLNRIAVYETNEHFGSLGTIVEFGNFMRKVKSTIENCARSISRIHKSHEERTLSRFLEPTSNIVDVRSIIKSKNIKPEKVTGIGECLPDSDLGTFDD